MSNTYLPDENTAPVVSFLEGLFGLAPSSESVISISSYRRTPLGDIEVTRPLDSWNGTAAFKKPTAHVCFLGLNVTSQNRAEVFEGLKQLGSYLQHFLSAAARFPYDAADLKDHRGFGTTSFIGFSRSFFWDRNNSEPRLGFDSQFLPREFKSEDSGHAALMGIEAPDLCITFEASNRSLVLEEIRSLVMYVRDSGWLELVGMREAARRDDGRNQLGFNVAKGNPKIEELAYATAFCGPADEAPLLVGGSYLHQCRYPVNYEAWQSLQQSEKERLIGITRDGIEVETKSQGIASVFARSDSPPIFRREADYLSIQSDGSVERGLSFQMFQRQPRKQFEVLFNRFLKHDATEGQLPILSTGILGQPQIECYFLPNGHFAEFPGQQFFQPEVFLNIQEGLHHFSQTNYSKAIASYETAERLEPSFVWPYALQAECYHDLQELSESRKVLARAAKVNPNHHLYLEQLGWQYYLEKDFITAARISRQAITAYYEDSYRSYPYHDLGAALLEQQNPVEAEVAFRRSVVRANIVAKNCFGLANSLDAQGRFREAQKIYDRTYEVAEYLWLRGELTRRDIRTVLELIFIHYRSEASVKTLERIRQLLQSTPA